MTSIRRRTLLAGAGALTAGLPTLAASRRAMAQASGPIKIGLSSPASGPLQVTGAGVILGAQIAVDVVNKTGGVLGRTVELVVKDSKASPTTAVANVREFLSEGIKLVNGGIITGEAMSIAPVLAENGGMLVTIGGAGMQLTHEAFNKMMFRATDQDYMEIKMLTEFAAERYPNVLSWNGVVADTAASRGSSGLFGELVVEAYAKKGKKAKWNGTIPISFSASDTRPMISQIMSSDTEGLYESIYGQLGATFYQQAAAFGLQKKVKVVLDRGMEWPTVRALKKNLPSNLWLMSYWFPERYKNIPLSELVNAEFHGRSKDEYPPNMTFSGTIGVQTYTDAIKATGSTEPGKIAEALRNGLKINTVRGPVMFRKEDQQALNNIDFVHVEGTDGDPGFKVVDLISKPSAAYMEKPQPGVEFKYPSA